MTVLIAGAGIAGLGLGLTLHQIGVPFRIFEAVRELQPLGLGINLQPNAVRELFALGLEAQLDRVGVRTRQYGFYSKHGKTIWEEPRGQFAGYDWPQYSVHRGRFQMMLYDALCARAGADCVVTGARAVGFENTGSGAELILEGGRRVQGDLVIAADGIHSALRAQMVPDEGAPIWSGAILWRGISKAPAFFGGAAMALVGHDSQRIVAYPISEPDSSGLVTMNWIAERRVDPALGWRREDWNRQADLDDFRPLFEGWVFDWLDVPALIRGAQTVYEYPMVDRDPLERWTQDRVTLMGDAAHPTYPVGSNGASQAIMDARALGAAFVEHGLTPQALLAYEARMRPVTTAIIKANRGSGPDAILQRVEDLCGGEFDRIEDVIPQSDLAAHAARYKELAGFAITELNASPPLIAPGQTVLPGQAQE